MNALPSGTEPCAATAVVVTPSGRGAVAVVVVEGTNAAQLVDACFRPAVGAAISARAVGRIVFGRWGDAAAPGEEVIACRKSETQVEIHCHGGAAAVERILGDLAERGAEVVDWPTWRMQTASDPIEAEADIALAAATTERTARVLLDQRQGALRRAIVAAIENLDNGRLDDVVASIATLVDRSALGRRLVEPWRVVLAGPPNVGKSSLINRLLGYDRAIVFDQPGTTRDVVTALTALDGWPIELSDTAGLCDSDDPIEQAGVALAREQIERADLVLLVDEACGSTQSQHAGETPWALLQSRPFLHVQNKCDLRPADGDNIGLVDPDAIRTSAKTGEGIAELAAAIVKRLVSRPPTPGEAVPFTERQACRLGLAATALRERRVDNARTALRHILGTPRSKAVDAPP